MRNQNWSKLQTGLVLYLKVEPEVIYDRIVRGGGGADHRPLLRTDDPLGTLRTLTEERRERYEQADVVVEVADMEAVAADMEAAVVAEDMAADGTEVVTEVAVVDAAMEAEVVMEADVEV